MRGSALLVALGVVLAGGNASAYEVKVLSATVKDKAVPDAKLTFQTAGESSVIGKTNASGVVSFSPAPFGGKDDGTVNLIIEKTGFSSLVVKCPCDGMTYALSENMTRAEGIRVVLNWGANPSDLDSHMAFGNNHVFFKQKKGDQTRLDVDDTTAFGPETITVDGWVTDKDYVYGVHNYSNVGAKGQKTFKGSEAKVFIYKRNVQQRVYHVNPEAVGNLWVLFRIDAAGTIHDIDKYTDVDDSAKVKKALLDKRWVRDAGATGLVASFDEVVLKKGPALVELGWSRKGKIAYVTFDYLTGQPCVTVAVQDMVTDKVVFEEKQCGPDASGKTPSSVDDWRMIPNIVQKMQGANIEPISRPIGRFPLSTRKGAIDVKVQGDELIASLGKRSKVLGKISDMDAKAEQKDVNIEGYFKSPFEPRVAVLYAVPVNKEGGYDYLVKLSGCHMKVGYKKRR